MVLNSSLNSNQAATIGINRITFVPHLFYNPIYLIEVARNRNTTGSKILAIHKYSKVQLHRYHFIEGLKIK
jgi:hypothetical protein